MNNFVSLTCGHVVKSYALTINHQHRRGKAKRFMGKVKSRTLFGNETPERKGFPTSLLLSGLQKAIRRNDEQRALKLTKFLFGQDPQSFFRRIVIIAAEDCLILPATGKIVELAREYGSKKRIATMTKEKIKADCQFALEVAQQLVLCPVRDYDGGGYVPYLYHRKDINKLPIGTTGLSKKEVELVEAIRKRKAVGGMRSDLWLLEIVARIWTDRFKRKQFTIKQLENYFPKPTVKAEKISDQPDESDIPIETIDSHCSGIVPMLLKKPQVTAAIKAAWGKNMTQEMVETKLKRTLFYCRSWINFKADIISGRTFNRFGTIVYQDKPLEQEKIRRVYEEIAQEVNKLSRWIIQQSLGN